MLTPQIILDAYSKGLFPMAENRRDKQLFWIDPEVRGILPLDNFHIPRSLKKKIRNNPFEVRFDHNFAAVIRACAQQKPKRRDTWINDEIIELYTKLFCMRHAHSVECWQEEKLVGGLYGISIGGAFFGESMFSSERDSSKIALVHLVARLKLAGFTLLDTQFITDHLKQFGAIEISRVEYHKILNVALNLNVGFHLEVSLDSEEGVLRRILQSKTQTS
jgi:leucyl/phenylalanyl-tRNA--protein transferase